MNLQSSETTECRSDENSVFTKRAHSNKYDTVGQLLITIQSLDSDARAMFGLEFRLERRQNSRTEPQPAIICKNSKRHAKPECPQAFIGWRSKRECALACVESACLKITSSLSLLATDI